MLPASNVGSKQSRVSILDGISLPRRKVQYVPVMENEQDHSGWHEMSSDRLQTGCDHEAVTFVIGYPVAFTFDTSIRGDGAIDPPILDARILDETPIRDLEARCTLCGTVLNVNAMSRGTTLRFLPIVEAMRRVVNIRFSRDWMLDSEDRRGFAIRRMVEHLRKDDSSDNDH